MRALARVALLVLAGCTSDPTPAESWHGAVRVDAARRGEASCEPGTEPIEPVEPFLFVAVLDGDPALTSLYWCETAEDCPPGPFATVDVERLGPRRLEGRTAHAVLLDERCFADWTGVEAVRDGDRVTLTWRTFAGEGGAGSEDQCDQFLESVLGACDEVLTVEGTRAP